MLGCEFNRIQFTPDLMPADITGTNVFNLQRNEFSLVKGPVFTTFLLADEINRAPAKTQSALLEAMQERTVTIDRETHRLSPNFTVFATQNPIESEGTYPLPEAQKDRFMLKIPMSWPARDEELELARRSLDAQAPEAVLQRGEVEPCLSEAELARAARGSADRSVVSERAGRVRRGSGAAHAHRRQHPGGRRARAPRRPCSAAPRLGRALGPRFRQPGRRSRGGFRRCWSTGCCCVRKRNWKACAPAKCWIAILHEVPVPR